MVQIDIEMPGCCQFCRIGEATINFWTLCRPAGRVNYQPFTRPDWCPLKEVPNA